jgi:HEAT repeat protein
LGRHLFVSYRSAELDFALQLAADLKNAGVRLWMDRLDIEWGDDWRNALEQNIDQASAMLVLLSPGYIRSRYCMRELARADHKDIRRLPILLHPMPEEEYPIELQREHYLDFTKWRDATAYKTKLALLLNYLRQHFPDLISTEPTPEARYLTRLITRLEAHLSLGAPQEDERSEMRSRWRMLPPALANHPAFSPLETLLQTFQKQPHLIITGAGGVGKSTLMRYMALQLAYARHQQLTQRLPFWVELSEWSNTRTWQDCLQLPSEATAPVAYFLDDMDTLSQTPERLEIVRQWVLNAPSETYIVLGSRSIQHLEAWGLPQFRISPMDAPQVMAYMENQVGTPHLPLPLQEWIEDESPLAGLLSNRQTLNYLVELAQSLSQSDKSLTLGKVLPSLLTKRCEYEAQRRNDPRLTPQRLTAGLAGLGLASLKADFAPIAPPKQAPLEDELLAWAEALHLIERQQERLRFTAPAWAAYFAVHDSHFSLKIAVRQSKYPHWKLALRLWVETAASPDAALLKIHQANPNSAFQLLLEGLRVSDDTCLPLLQTWGAAQAQATPIHLARQLSGWDVAQCARVLLKLLRVGPLEERQRWHKILRALHSLPGVSLEQVWQPLNEGLPDSASEALQALGENALFCLFRQLTAKDPQARAQAAWAIGTLRDAAGVAALTHALRDRESQVVLEAALGLGSIGDIEGLLPLVELLAHPHNNEVAMNVLTWLGSAAQPALQAALAHPKALVRTKAVHILSAWPTLEADPLLKKASQDSNLEVRTAALTILNSKEEPTAMFTRLRKALGARDEPTAAPLPTVPLTPMVLREEATKATPPNSAGLAKDRLIQEVARATQEQAQLQQDPLLRPLHDLLHSMDWNQRAQAAKALRDQAKAQRGHQRDDLLPPLVAALHDTHATIRSTVIEALAWLHDPRAIPDLIPLVEDNEWAVRMTAIYALAELGATSASDAIRAHVNDPHTMVANAAIEALGALSASPALDQLGQVLADPHSDPFKRLAAVEAVGQVQDQAALPLLCSALKDQDKHVRWKAAQLLSQAADPRSESALIAALHDPDSPQWEVKRICDLAREGLQQIGSDSAKAAVLAWQLANTILPTKIIVEPKD